MKKVPNVAYTIELKVEALRRVLAVKRSGKWRARSVFRTIDPQLGQGTAREAR